MAVSIIDRWDTWPVTGDESGGSTSYRGLLQTTAGEQEAEVYAFLIAALPAVRYGLWLKSARVTPLGGPVWEAAAEYGVNQTGNAGTGMGDPTQTDPGTGLPSNSPSTPARNDKLGPEFSLSTTGGTEKLRMSKGWRIRRAIQGRDVPKFRGLIGLQEDGSIEGCEVVVPKVEWKTTRHVEMTLDYQEILADLTGTVNDRVWFGVWQPGQVLFLGTDGGFKDPDKGWQITLAFQIARHRVCTGRAGNGVGGPHPTNFLEDDGEDLIAPGLVLGKRTYNPDGSYQIDSVEEVAGWDHIWVAYEPAVDELNKKDVERAWMFEVCRVYPRRDFRRLGLGG